MALERQYLVRTLLGAAALVFVAGRSLGGTVVIIEGTDATRNATVRRIADAAQANYTAQGYTVNRLSNMNGAVTRAAAVAAINANGVNAVFFMGHGTTNNGMFTPGLVLDSTNNTALTPADLAGNYAGIRHVELQACGQNLAGWQNAFPNAQLDAWGRSVTTDQIVNDVRFGAPARIPAKNPAGQGGAAGNRLGMDARFENQILQSAAHQSLVTTDAYLDDWTTLGYTLTSSELAQFGAAPRTFNIQTTDGTSVWPLRGLTIDNGMVTQDMPTGYTNPSFTLTINTNAFESAMENIDLVGSLLGSQATISGNLSGVSDQVAFNAAAAVYFGYNAVPAPGAAGMLVGVGLLALRRRR